MSQDTDVDLTQDRLLFLSEHIVYKAVCAPAAWDGERVERELAEANICPGTSANRWVVSGADSLPEGVDENPACCNDDPNRRHWLLNC